MIPKIIHYCWFGGNPKPKLAEKCIKSWKKYCKDYEIKEWNEENFDISSAPLYVRQAYEAKKWAFVTDYVRLWAMVKYGGIYMDTDVEVVKPIDKFLDNDAFSGFESEAMIPTGIMACRKDFPLFKELLHEYDYIPFVLDDGTFDITTNVVRITECCNKHGFVPNGDYQIVSGFALYPKDYFCPAIDYLTMKAIKTENTYTIHHFMGSWLSDEAKTERNVNITEIKKKQKKWRKEEKKWKRKQILDKFIHFPNRFLRKVLGTSKYNSLRSTIHR